VAKQSGALAGEGFLGLKATTEGKKLKCHKLLELTRSSKCTV
jgi:hypothetical protein